MENSTVLINVNYSPYFTRHKLTTVAEQFYNKIIDWESWYRAYVPRIHRYTINQGKGRYHICARKSLGMAKKLCEDIADLLLNERVDIVVEDEATNDYVHSVLDASNFWRLGNEYQERKAATGTAAYVPYITSIRTDAEGNVIDADIRINYFSARHIFPTSWSNGQVEEAVFAFDAEHLGKRYALMQYHHREKSETGGYQYVIDSEVINANGGPVDEATKASIPAFADISDRVYTGSSEPQFVIDKLAIVNNASEDETNPMGVAIFANCIDILTKLDLEYDSYANEFTLGKKRLFVAPEFMQDENGELVYDPNDLVFSFLPEDTFKDADPIKEVNMNLRIQEHKDAIDQDLNILSLKAGLGTQYYSFERGGIATATQVISEQSDLYRTVKKHELVLGDVLTGLVRIIIGLGKKIGHTELRDDVAVKIDFDDSIIEDKAAERERALREVSVGILNPWEYRAKYYGETEAVAKASLPEPESGSDILV